MFGIGFGELIIIFIVALLVVGPHKLPEMAKSLAKVFREVRKTSDEFQASIFRENHSSISGLLKSPEATIKRHLENEVQEALGLDAEAEVSAATPDAPKAPEIISQGPSDDAAKSQDSDPGESDTETSGEGVRSG